MRLSSILRYWHTLKYLRPVQFYGRLWFRFHRPRPSLVDLPARRIAISGWQRPAEKEPSLVNDGEFRFLNETGKLEVIGWDCEQRSKLWRYNQHYFDDLNAKAASERFEWHRLILLGWVSDNPVGEGSGWEPYPTSLRIVNWVKWACVGNQLPPECEESLAVQARWLTGRLEIHLLGNHLFANAKALVFAGCYFEGPEAESWVVRGLKILEREVPEQILADGGHFERSTMYHAMALEDMLDLVNLLGVVECESSSFAVRTRHFVALCRQKIPSMIQWMNAMCHPDGDIAFFNDAAFGIAPSPFSLRAYADRLGFKGREVAKRLIPLQESGYFRLATEDACVLFDAAAVGPDYLPGHAHADTLSFELSFWGHRLLVNSGTSEYGISSERLRQRSTAAHNTVEVNGEDSSEVWSGFRTARRAYPFDVTYRETESGQHVSACHNGYRRLPSSVSVCRSLELAGDSLTVTDYLDGQWQIAVARFFLHPGIAAYDEGKAGIRLRLPGGEECILEFIGAGQISLIDATWHPRFGVTEQSRCIRVEFTEDRLVSRFYWGQR